MPDQMTEVMALMGDSIDNIPGVPGIGEKKAIRLIQQFGSLEELLKNLDRVDDKRSRKALESYEDQARLSKRLATIDCNVPMECHLEAFRLSEPSAEELRRIFKELEITKFLSAIPKSKTLPTDAYQTVTDGGFIREILEANNLFLLWDIAHSAITAFNRGMEHERYLGSLPLERCVQVHLSRYGKRDGLAYDAHDLIEEEDWIFISQRTKQLPKLQYATVEYYKSVDHLIVQLQKLRMIMGGL